MDHLSKNREEYKWEPIDGKISVTNDLGYTYGKVIYKEAKESKSAYYLHIWKKDNKSKWKLLIDMLTEIPE